MKVYTVANDEKNKGYTATVKALAGAVDGNYDNTTQHLKSTKQGDSFEDTELKTFVDNVSVSIANGEKVCILFAGGDGWNERINTIQSQFKGQKVKYAFNTERIDEGENFNGIENLDVITQETEEKVNSVIGTGKNITTHVVDIAAYADANKIQNDAQNFEQANTPQTINTIKEIIKDTPCLFYLGGRGLGFAGNKEFNTETFKHFAQESLKELNGQGNLVVFTHGLRTFTDINSNNMFEPVNTMYQYIQENLQEGQKAYIFSQNEKEGNKRTPILKEITKEGINDIEIKGNPYNWSLIQAQQNGQSVYATQEQQNFPIEALSAGIKNTNIKGIKWALQADIHEDLYKDVINKNNFTTSADIFKNIAKDKLYKYAINKDNFRVSDQNYKKIIKDKLYKDVMRENNFKAIIKDRSYNQDEDCVTNTLKNRRKKLDISLIVR